MTPAAELQRMRDRVIELEELLGFHEPRSWGSLLPRPRRGAYLYWLAQCDGLLELLLRRELVSHQTALVALYGGRPGDVPNVKIIDGLILRCRRWLEPFGIVIRNDHGRGFFLDAENKAKLRTLRQALLWGGPHD